MTDEEVIILLAERVMGWKEAKSTLTLDAGTFYISKSDGRLHHERAFQWWNPLTSEVDACAVLDKMAQVRDIWLAYEAVSSEWCCWFSDKPIVRNTNRNRAICLAALKAVGVKVE